MKIKIKEIKEKKDSERFQAEIIIDKTKGQCELKTNDIYPAKGDSEIVVTKILPYPYTQIELDKALVEAKDICKKRYKYATGEMGFIENLKYIFRTTNDIRK